MPNTRRQDVSIGGNSLRAVDPRVIFRSVTEEDNDVDYEFASYAGRSGRILTASPLRRGKTIKIAFAIRELYDLTARAEVLEKVNAWAADTGNLTMTSRPGRTLPVVCTKRAAGGNLRDYTAEYEIEYQSRSVPYWQSTEQTTHSYTGAGTTSILMSVGGTAPTPVNVTVSLASAIDKLTVTVTSSGSNSITVTKSAASGDTISISHDANGFLRVAYRASGSQDNTYIMDCVDPASSDDLTADPRATSVTLRIRAELDGATLGTSYSGSIYWTARWL